MLAHSARRFASDVLALVLAVGTLSCGAGGGVSSPRTGAGRRLRAPSARAPSATPARCR